MLAHQDALLDLGLLDISLLSHHVNALAGLLADQIKSCRRQAQMRKRQRRGNSPVQAALDKALMTI